MSSSPDNSSVAQTENKTNSESKYDPSAFLHQIIGQEVVVKIFSGVEYRGKLYCCI